VNRRGGHRGTSHARIKIFTVWFLSLVANQPFRQMERTVGSNVKLTAAVIGGSAVIAMGALGVALGQQPDDSTQYTASQMNLGPTSTQTTPSAAPAVAMAVPAIKGPARFKAHT
jgi:hypothetical protein